MEPQPRRLRGLLYILKDIESALRQGARPTGLESITRATASFASATPAEFLHESRAALEAVLLGERDLPGGVVGDILEAIAVVDEMLVDWSVQ